MLEYYWGEHIHLGWYAEGQRKGPFYGGKDFIEAKYDFTEKMLEFSKTDKPTKVLDVGCGIGGTSRYYPLRTAHRALPTARSSLPTTHQVLAAHPPPPPPPARYLAKRFPEAEVTGITISQEQQRTPRTAPTQTEPTARTSSPRTRQAPGRAPGRPATHACAPPLAQAAPPPSPRSAASPTPSSSW